MQPSPLPLAWCRKHLSPAEQLVVARIGQGLPLKLIASDLGKSEHTIRNQLARAMQKLGVRSRYELFLRIQRLPPRPETGDVDYAACI